MTKNPKPENEPQPTQSDDSLAFDPTTDGWAQPDFGITPSSPPRRGVGWGDSDVPVDPNSSKGFGG